MKGVMAVSKKKYIMAGILLLIPSAYIFISQSVDYVVPDLLQDIVHAEPKQLNEFHLTSHDEKMITSKNFLNQWTFVFFGFTHCPDVCPATLSQLVHLNKLLKNKNLSERTRFLFVSVDPERDTTKHLSQFVRYFDTSFVGATGDKENIMKLENNFGAFHKIEKNGSNNFYNVSHTASVFLVNPSGEYIADFEPPMNISRALQQFDMLVNQYANKLS